MTGPSASPGLLLTSVLAGVVVRLILIGLGF